MIKSILTTEIETWVGLMIVIFIAVSLGMFVFLKVSELNDYIELNRSELYKEDVLRLKIED